MLKPDFLPADAFAALRAAAFDGPLPAREIRHGRTVTRMTPLSHPRLGPARAAAGRSDLAALMVYAAGRSGAPLVFLQTAIAEAGRGGADPQTELHAETFHLNAKAWLFLDDVGAEDGPFVFVPGSHRLTPERLACERAQSLMARDDPRRHHALGSFRIAEEALAGLGYGAPRFVTARANTLIVADTFGFRRRSPSARRTVRVELHAHLRRNPFLPWNGLDFAGLPGVAGRQVDLFFGWLDLRARLSGAGSIWRDIGAVAVDAPPQC